MRFTLLVVSVVVALGACSTGAPRTGVRQKRCEPVELDARWTADGPVYRACDVDVMARPIGAPPRVSYQPTRPAECTTALVDFVVDSTGMPEVRSARIVRATDSDLGHALLSTVPERRYTPAVLDGRPVRQIAGISSVITMKVTAVSSGPGTTASPVLRTPTRLTCKP